MICYGVVLISILRFISYFLLWCGEWKWFLGYGSCLYSKYTPGLSLGDLCTGNQDYLCTVFRGYGKRLPQESPDPKTMERWVVGEALSFASMLASSWLWSTTEGSSVGYDSDVSTKKKKIIKTKEIVLLFEQEIAVYCCAHLNAQWQLLPTDDLAMKRIKQPNHLPLGKKATYIDLNSCQTDLRCAIGFESWIKV